MAYIDRKSDVVYAIEAKDVLQTNCTQTAERAENPIFCSCWPWPLIFGLDIQTHPSEGPNTPSLWIWCKATQRLPDIFRTQTRKSHSTQKNRTLRSSLRAVKTVPFQVI